MSSRSVRAASAAFLLPLAAAAQESASPFDGPAIAFDDTKRIVATADLDGDGDRDALGFWMVQQNRANVHAFANDGTGRFTLAWSFDDTTVTLADATVWSMEVGRFDADARDDFVLRIGNHFTVYASNGLAPPSVIANWIEPGSAAGGGLVVADFDRDGRDDFAAHLGSSVRLYRNTQLGFSVTGSAAVPAGQLKGADLDADGDADLVLGASGEFRVIWQQGASLSAGPTIAHGLVRGTSEVMTVPGDVDGDGDDDVVAFASWGEYRVLRQGPTGQLALEATRVGGPATGLADLDGDGDLDGTCCGGGGGGNPTLYNWTPATFELCINRGGGDFAPAWRIPSLGAARLAGAVDLDGDGDLDLIAGRVVWFNHGATFTRDPRAQHGIWFGLWRPSFHDFDLDGDPDASAIVQSRAFTRFVSDGTGAFWQREIVLPSLPFGQSYVGPGWNADFDGDGDDDLIVNVVAGTTFVRTQRFLNAGNGQFLDGGPASPQGVAFSWFPETSIGWRDHIADLDGDGDLDVATYYGFTAWNDGTGFFTPGTGFTGGAPCASGDFDGNGHPDLVIARNARIEIAYGDNRVFGGFGNTQVFGAGGDGDDAAASAVDVDADGDVDLITCFGSIVLARNLGGRNWQEVVLDTHVNYAGREFLWVEDFDGDGVRDVLAGQCTGPAFAWLRGRAGGVFDPAVLHLAGSAFGVCDTDGDGDLDLCADGIVRNATRDDPVAYRWQYGTSGAGSGGFAPVLGALGPFREGDTVRTFVRGALGGTAGAWIWSSSASNLPDTPFAGLTMYASPILVAVAFGFGGPGGVPGAGHFEASYVVQPGSAGVALAQQFFVLDSAAPSLLVHSNGLQIRYGY